MFKTLKALEPFTIIILCQFYNNFQITSPLLLTIAINVLQVNRFSSLIPSFLKQKLQTRIICAQMQREARHAGIHTLEHQRNPSDQDCSGVATLITAMTYSRNCQTVRSVRIISRAQQYRPGGMPRDYFIARQSVYQAIEIGGTNQQVVSI